MLFWPTGLKAAWKFKDRTVIVANMFVVFESFLQHAQNNGQECGL